MTKKVSTWNYTDDQSILAAVSCLTDYQSRGSISLCSDDSAVVYLGFLVPPCVNVLQLRILPLGVGKIFFQGQNLCMVAKHFVFQFQLSFLAFIPVINPATASENNKTGDKLNDSVSEFIDTDVKKSIRR